MIFTGEEILRCAQDDTLLVVRWECRGGNLPPVGRCASIDPYGGGRGAVMNVGDDAHIVPKNDGAVTGGHRPPLQ